MEWMLMPLQRYADFNGRSRRMEYWMFALLSFMIYAIGAMLFLMDGSANEYASEPGILFYLGIGIMVLWAIATFIPSIAVAVRRFHDQDKSGWMYLLSFIPYVGGLILIIFMCLDGTTGPNQYGPDPKGRHTDTSSVFD